MKHYILILLVTVFLTVASVAQPSPQPDSPLFIVHKPKAEYPTSEGGTVCITGTVRLRIEFLASGEIGTITLISELPIGATEIAIEAARKIVFVPERRNFENVTVHKIVFYNFGID
ncbi:MAG: hypothetical protein H0V76_05955 [Blastocatellia bacterium]|nr:hypothetical protein [Blastocatellia bacterium]